jgi:tRNA A-37 threonylcarbamoyl transferase component Bud32
MTATIDRVATALSDRYRIERELGAGGMATVYLAEDIRHGRRVAIKVLHPELSAVLGPDRFLAEIKLTAALQHPHILPLFDSGSADGLLFYVMPYVEGETLRDRLTRERQLPIGDSVRITTEVADALGYAHGRGIVHRDIKPENILLRDGHALVADFGIALAVRQAGGERMTQTGMSLGTPQYMAPEQAMGERNVDHRSDIYALAVVAYEMIAGEPPFTGPSASAIVAKVMTEEPKPLAEARRSVPPAVEAAVHAGLAKLPADRPDSAADFIRALSVDTASRRDRVDRRGWHIPAAGLAAALLLAVASAVGAYAAGKRSAAGGDSVQPSRLAILSPDIGGTGVAAQYRQVAITPGGDAIVFVGVNANRQNHLAYQRLDESTHRLIEGAMGMLSPQISPDGSTLIGFGAGLVSGEQEHALRLPLTGGVPVSLGNVVQSRHAHWAADGTYWFSPGSSGGIARLADDGGVIPALGGRTEGLQVQQIFDDGRSALVVRSPLGTASGPVVIVDLERGDLRTLIETPTVEARIAVGQLLSVRPDGTMWAAPFDERSARITGSAVQIAGGVSLTGTQVAQWAVAPTGTIAYIPEEPRSLVIVDREGAMRSAVGLQRNFHSPRFSPTDRTELAVDFTSADGRDVWILSLVQGTLNRATFKRDGHDATWSNDGRTIAFTSFREGGALGVYRTRPGGGTTADSLFASTKLGYTGTWTPSGDSLVSVATDIEPGSGIDIVVIDSGGRGSLRPLLVDQFDTQYPVLSPDGRWIAFVSNQSGGQQVYVRPLSGEGRQLQVSQDGGTEPLWSRDGRELFYMSTDEADPRFMSAALRVGAGIEIVSRRSLFSVSEIVSSNPHPNYDVSLDGRSFVMVRRSPANRIVVLQNLPELVRRLRTENPMPR